MLTKAMCTFFGASGLAADRFVNTFYFFKGSAHTDPERVALAAALEEFYDDTILVGATARKLTDFMNMAGLTATEQMEVKMYTMADPTPRIPTHVSLHSLTTNAILPLPHEVAVCMSYRGTPAAGIPVGRRRGRIYLGPLNVNAQQTSPPNGESRPTANLTALVPLIAQRLKDAVEATGSDWGIHSPTSGPEAFRVIASVACDDAWDTQRRRGLAPTSAAYTALT